MPVFDASSIIYAWDNYPERQFPGLWDWIASQITNKSLLMSAVAVEEVDHMAPECGKWLKAKGLVGLPVSDDILVDALRIKNLLDIEGDKFGNGVDENDLLIIATARNQITKLVSDERRQPDLPKLKHNYKIPAVCAMPEVGVPCLSFIEYLKLSEAVFR
ncbi:MAG: DUF4411 family protein [Methylococcus sp.]|nr:DUF4411 family protein [Methylococcus sp.]